MIELLKNIDTRLFLFFNGNHTPLMDSVMMIVTNKFTWIPLYILLLTLVIWKFKKKCLLILVSVSVLILASDQTSVLIKNSVKRYRPCYNLELKGKVHLIDGCGGQYGFVSSHAANVFALATFLSFFFRRKDCAACFFLWASLVSYSRVYLGHHYPFDILGGATLGLLIGAIAYKIYFHSEKKIKNR